MEPQKELTSPRKPRSEKRRRQHNLRVRVDDGELRTITERAESCSLPIAGYLRICALGFEPRSTIDARSIRSMLRVNADLGRLGGLLKLWLTEPDRLADAKEDGIGPDDIRGLLRRLEVTQAVLKKTVDEIPL